MLIHRVQSFAAASIFVLSLGGVPALAQQSSPEETTPVLDIGKMAVITKDGQLRLSVDVACGSRWSVVESYVYVVQNAQQSANASIPVVCGPSDHPAHYDVLIPAIPGGYQAGDAQASAYVLLMESGSSQTTALNDTSNIVIRTTASRAAPTER